MSTLDKSGLGSPIAYAAATVALRAARIAILVPNTPDWAALVGLVTDRCTRAWGGAGFILIPHQDGHVDPLWLRVASVYDPDHVVTCNLPLGLLAEIAPERYKMVDSDGQPIPEEDLSKYFADHLCPLSSQDGQAREAVAAACTPFRDWSGSAEEGRSQRYSMEHLRFDEVADDEAPADEIDPGKPLDFTSTSTALASVLIASVLGWRGVAASPGRDTPPSTADELGAYIRTLDADPRGLAPRDNGGWRHSMRGLSLMTSVRAREAHWLVFGSSLADFALFHALTRMGGDASWLPDSWTSDQSPYLATARSIAHRAELKRHDGEVLLTSTSVNLAEGTEVVRSLVSWALPNDSADWLTPREPEAIGGANLPISMLALEQESDRDLALPVVVAPDGSRELVNRLPAQVPEKSTVNDSRRPQWIIDVNLHDQWAPTGRGLPPNGLQAGDDPWRERVRSARDGLSIIGHSFGIVFAGSTLRQSTARPRLRFASLQSWAVQMATASGLQLTPSDAGHISKVAAEVWGSRESLAADLAMHFPLFAEFLTDTERTIDRYPKLDGVVIRREGFLTYAAAQRITASYLPEETCPRGVLDRLTKMGGLRRGLVLSCPSCSFNQFSPLLRGTLLRPCVQCATEIPLEVSTWKEPDDEPHWYYDLHPVVRRLINCHGDVALLVEHHLRQKTPGLVGVDEFELRPTSPLEEIDLLCGNSTTVFVGECKLKPTLGDRLERGKKVNSLIHAAQIFRADQIILASAEPGEWNAASVAALKTGVASGTWVNGVPPQLRLITNARSRSPHDVAG